MTTEFSVGAAPDVKGPSAPGAYREGGEPRPKEGRWKGLSVLRGNSHGAFLGEGRQQCRLLTQHLGLIFSQAELILLANSVSAA